MDKLLGTVAAASPVPIVPVVFMLIGAVIVIESPVDRAARHPYFTDWLWNPGVMELLTHE